MCLQLEFFVFFYVWIFGLLVSPSSSRDGREWELGKWAMFCWSLWTGGLKEQLCRESQHPALYCTSPVIIEVIIEVVFWPLKPAVLSGSLGALCVPRLSLARHNEFMPSSVSVYSRLIEPATTYSLACNSTILPQGRYIRTRTQPWRQSPSHSNVSWSQNGATSHRFGNPFFTMLAYGKYFQAPACHTMLGLHCLATLKVGFKACHSFWGLSFAPPFARLGYQLVDQSIQHFMVSLFRHLDDCLILFHVFERKERMTSFTSELLYSVMWGWFQQRQEFTKKHNLHQTCSIWN